MNRYENFLSNWLKWYFPLSFYILVIFIYIEIPETIIEYYAYLACAYLYKLGYKAKGEIVHKVINESLIVQARHKIKNHILLGHFQDLNNQYHR